MTLEIGDKATINVCKENREWGYDPLPDGTEVTVVSFSTIYKGRLHCANPGLYENRCYYTVITKDGKEVNIGDFHLEYDHSNRPYHNGNRLGDLPKTDLVELDLVRLTNRSEKPLTRIVDIEYHQIGETTIQGTPWPIYTVKYEDGSGTTSVAFENCELIERGNCWKEENGEPLVFSSLEDEANYASQRRRYTEVRNPIYGNYRWDNKEQQLDALEKRIGHGLHGSNTPMIGASVSVIKFHDETLGEKVRQFTLKNFNKTTNRQV